MTGRVTVSNPKGTQWETRLVRYLVDKGFPYVERRARSGRNDKGDLSGLPGIVIEAKNVKALNLAGWIDELVVEKRNAGVEQGAVIFPRKSHTTGLAYVLLELDDYLELIR